MSETVFTRQVIDLARLYGWRTLHIRPGRTGKGWRTCVQGDGVGWPDCVFCHPIRGLLLFRELKTDTGKLTDAQADWLNALQSAEVDAGVWRPRDMDVIVAVLSGVQR